MGQANAFYPLILAGLNWSAALLFSILRRRAGGRLYLYHLLGRKLSDAALRNEDDTATSNDSNMGLIAIINTSGADAIRLALGLLPMLILSLSVVGILRASGSIEWLTPLLNSQHISDVYVLPALTKSGGRHGLLRRGRGAGGERAVQRAQH